MSHDHPASPPLSLGAELVLHCLRLAVKVSLNGPGLSLDELQRLLKVAAFQELRDQGYSLNEMCVQLTKTRSTVRRLGKLAREVGNDNAGEPFLRRLMVRLQAKPATLLEVSTLRSPDAEIDGVAIALKLLEREGLIKMDVDTGIYALTDVGCDRLDAPWSRRIESLGEQHFLSIRVLQALFIRPASGRELRRLRCLRRVPLPALSETLTFLEQQGHLRGEGEGPKRCYTLMGRHIRIIPSSPQARLRLGLVDLLGKVGDGLSFALEGKEPELLAQRNLTFSISAAALKAFIQAHMESTVSALQSLEAEGRGGEGDQEGDERVAFLSWIAAPIEQT